MNDAVHEGPFQLPSGLLRDGDNVLAAEVHQAALAGGDVIFGAALEATVAEISGDVTLNEIMAVNRSAVVNGGKNPDWIELFNRGNQAVDLGGMTLSDNPAAPAKFVFPAGTLLGPQGYLLVWDAKPFILSSPQSVRAAAGATAQLVVQAVGEGPLQYQWRRNGLNVPGATSSVLVLSPLETGLVGKYTVLVSDWGGSEETLPVEVSLLP